MERTAQNRVIFGANAKKEKSRNPHGYWIFRWRRVWDSNPRGAHHAKTISSRSRYDHFDTSPYMSARRFFLPFFGGKGLWKELTERTAFRFIPRFFLRFAPICCRNLPLREGAYRSPSPAPRRVSNCNPDGRRYSPWWKNPNAPASPESA